MRRRLAVLTITAAAVGAAFAAPASATCMETFNRYGVRMGSCAPPGGPVTSYVCYHDTCVYH